MPSRAEKLDLFGADRFEVTADHLLLLRAAVVCWQDCETGAPAIDPKRPYGNGDVIGDIHELLTGEALDEEDNRADVDRYRELHRETEQALQIGLATGSFEPGVYETPKYHNLWERANG